MFDLIQPTMAITTALPTLPPTKLEMMELRSIPAADCSRSGSGTGLTIAHGEDG